MEGPTLVSVGQIGHRTVALSLPLYGRGCAGTKRSEVPAVVGFSAAIGRLQIFGTISAIQESSHCTRKTGPHGLSGEPRPSRECRPIRDAIGKRWLSSNRRLRGLSQTGQSGRWKFRLSIFPAWMATHKPPRARTAKCSKAGRRTLYSTGTCQFSNWFSGANPDNGLSHDWLDPALYRFRDGKGNDRIVR